MLKYLLILFFLAANIQLITAQEPFLLPPRAKEVNVKNFIKEGFYLLKSGKFPKEINLSGVKIVKSYAKDAHIIQVSSVSDLKFTADDTLYEISADWKLAPALQRFRPEAPVLLSVNTVDAVEFKEIRGMEILQEYQNYFIIRASPGDFNRLLKSDLVTHISLYKRPQVETAVNKHDLTVNNINFVHHRYPEVRGENLKVSIKEFLFDTTDIDLKN
ncbi:hypothetical protein LZ575_14210 [Antarcticibacterium sp. 1MA-6-2]|uniref:hypothetical protein n=1 Tax=Antarcticibacterium sp. 1MA-6-2 TaxID=2908210 RepID=UPI001F2E1B55|nr:hypothetical protein [Antarcticibacterium sp. 1MA-6-2]UJH90066.1 hypothetical protein LZ575_14210 [Antarcticibacterium sp. 1MA-6-2]